ncbi:MAG: DUF1801 domain-containing protein [Chitinophagales bacterium]
MLKPIEEFYANLEEPTKSCFLALKSIILDLDVNITAAWKYRMPFFCYKQKMFCYLWTDKKTGEPYIGIVEGNRIEHRLLEQGNRSRMKILRVNPREDLEVELIEEILGQALELYKDGTVKV